MYICTSEIVYTLVRKLSKGIVVFIQYLRYFRNLLCSKSKKRQSRKVFLAYDVCKRSAGRLLQKSTHFPCVVSFI